MNGLKLIKKHFRELNHPGFGLFEFGINRECVFDCLLVKPSSKRFRGFEFKVSRSDFLRDKNSGKWKKYLKYCHTFTWVCPKGLINKEEIEKPAGLLWISTIGDEYGYKEQRFFEIPHPIWIKRPTTNEISKEIWDEIVLILIGRVKYRKEAFF